MEINLFQFSQTFWREVIKKVNKAAVYVDNEAAECLHWYGGAAEMLSSGALLVREFSSLESGEVNQKKAVFITSSPCVSVTREILKNLIQSSNFEYCILITAVHPNVYYLAKHGTCHEREGGMAIFDELEIEMLQWMGNVNYTVEIFHMPLFMVCVTKNVFFTPPFKNMFPLLHADLPRLRDLHTQVKKTDGREIDSLASLDMDDLPLELQICIHHLVYSLHSYFSSLNIREDIYSLGATSELIAKALEKLPQAANRRQGAINHCSLLLVDRTLDLFTPTGHGSSSLLDRIVAVLPHLPGHCVDVAVDISSLCNHGVCSTSDAQVIAPGCLASSDEESSQVIEWLVGSQQADVLSNLHQLLQSIMPEEMEDIASLVTPEALEKEIANLKGKHDVCYQNYGLLQCTLAVTQSLKSPQSDFIEQLLGIEKLLFLCLNSDKDMTKVQEQLRKFVQTRRERNLSLRQLLTLLIHVNSVTGTSLSTSETEELQLQDALRWTLLQDRDPDLLPEDADEDLLQELLTKIMDRLHSIKRARDSLTKYRSLLHPQAETQSSVPCGLLQSVATDLSDCSKPVAPDIVCQSSGLKKLLKSGFSMLMNRPRQQHPLDSPLVMVFVVGGVTAQEAQIIQEKITGPRILVGGTRLVTADDIYKFVFVNDPLMQQT